MYNDTPFARHNEVTTKQLVYTILVEEFFEYTSIQTEPYVKSVDSISRLLSKDMLSKANRLKTETIVAAQVPSTS